MNPKISTIVVKPITLEGTAVRLEPLRLEHAPRMWDVVKSDLADTFRWLPYSMQDPEDFQRWSRKLSASWSVASPCCSRRWSAAPDE